MEFEIKDIEYDVLQALMDYVYKGKILIQYKNLPSLIKFAELFQFFEVEKFCTDYMNESMNNTNCLIFWSIASKNYFLYILIIASYIQ